MFAIAGMIVCRFSLCSYFEKNEVNAEQFLSSYEFEGKTKYFVIQAFLPRGFFIERDARINPASAYHKEIDGYYEEIGTLKASRSYLDHLDCAFLERISGLDFFIYSLLFRFYHLIFRPIGCSHTKCDR
jgi:hypothetical protein